MDVSAASGATAPARPAAPGARAPLALVEGAPRPLPPAPPARLRRRHLGLIASFALLVAAPVAAAAWYLWAVAAPQFQSRLGFSVQREDAGPVMEMLGGVAEVAAAGSADTDILYRFLRSREMVLAADRRLDLRRIWSHPGDPVFALPAQATAEDLEAHWNRKVDVFYDSAARLIEVRVLAFSPGDAAALAAAIAAESTRVLNEMSAAARADATAHARAELAAAEARLREARAALTAFRVETQIVDPAADIAGRMGLLNSLLAQQAEALIDLDMLAASTTEGDPRMVQARRRLEVIEARIAEERDSFATARGPGDRPYADLVARFEALSVDLEFARAAYVAAMAGLDRALAEAARQSRYLAVWLPPTRAERAEFPQRGLNLALLAGALLALWSAAALAFYALRDRR